MIETKKTARLTHLGEQLKNHSPFGALFVSKCCVFETPKRGLPVHPGRFTCATSARVVVLTVWAVVTATKGKSTSIFTHPIPSTPGARIASQIRTVRFTLAPTFDAVKERKLTCQHYAMIETKKTARLTHLGEQLKNHSPFGALFVSKCCVFETPKRGLPVHPGSAESGCENDCVDEFHCQYFDLIIYELEQRSTLFGS